jgi:hypothetical protein
MGMLKLKNLLLLLVLRMGFICVDAQGGGGGNNGPIFDSHTDTLCQDKLFPPFPVREDLVWF